MNENDLIDLFQSTVSQPWLFFPLIIMMTFILEDLAIAVTAIITAQHDMAIFTPLMALFIGIVVGDIGLYGLGKLSYHIPFLKKFINSEKIQKAQVVIDKNLILTIFTSRFIPGMRLPTYVTMGLLHISFKKFMGAVFIAVGLWSSAVFYLFYSFEHAANDIFGEFKWYALGAAIILFLTIPKLINFIHKKDNS